MFDIILSSGKHFLQGESVRRASPFFIVFVVYEVIESIFVTLWNFPSSDLPFNRLFAATINLICEFSSSFLFQLLPYWLYLAALPSVFHGGATDRRLTLLFFILFCTVNCCEETAEILCGGNLSFYSFQFLHNPIQTWNNFLSSAPFFPLLSSILSIVILTVSIGQKYLIPKTGIIPHTAVRYSVPLFATCVAFGTASIGEWIQPSTDQACFIGEALFNFFGDLYTLTPMPDLPKIFTIPVYRCTITVLCFFTLFTILRKRSALFPLRKKYNWHFRVYHAIFALLTATLVLRLASLGAYPLMDTTEARYGEIARKMIETGNWLTPQFDYGIPFWGKPPLSFWASAFTMRIFGIGEYGARLAPFLASIALGWLLLKWKYERDESTQALAGWLVFTTSVMGFVASGAVMTDEFLTLGVTLSMISFWKTLSRTTGKKWGYLFFVGLAISALSKGPIGIV